MMKKTILGGLFLLSVSGNAQPKIGIGVNSPQVQLDVIKSIRMGGVTPASAFLNYDSATGNFTWSRSNIFAPGNQPLIKHGSSLEGLYYNSSALEYKNDIGLLQFKTHWPSGDGYIGGNLGIQKLDPGSPLHFGNFPGEKIILYGGATYNYGIGMGDFLLQIHSDQYASTIEFGSGSNANFTELMRIQGNGRVGIGTNDPQAAIDAVKGSNLATAAFFASDINAGKNSHFNYGSSEHTYIRGNKIILNDILGGKVGIGIEPTFADAVLEVNGRINIRKFTFSNKGGYYLNNSYSLGGLVAMLLDNVGIYGANNSSASFEMNAISGALRFGHSAGNAGHILQSKGSSDDAVWVSATNPAYNSTAVITSSSSILIPAGISPMDIPGTTYSFNLSGNATLIVSYNMQIEIPNNEERFANAYVDLVFDNNTITRSGTYTDYRMQTITGTAVISAGAGSHFIKLKGSCTNWNVTFNPNSYIKCLFVQVLNK